MKCKFLQIVNDKLHKHAWKNTQTSSASEVINIEKLVSKTYSAKTDFCAGAAGLAVEYK